jgi:hypothetical protein
VLRVRRRRRDLGIAPSGVQPLLGDRRVVVEVDQVVRDAGMAGLALEDRLQDRGTLELVGIALVARRGGDVEGDRVFDLRLVVGRIARGDRFHRLQIGLHALAVRHLVMIGVEDEQRIDVVALALRLGSHIFGFLQGREAGHEVVLRWCRVRVQQQAQRDAPVGDPALRISSQRFLEQLLARPVPERVLVAHGAVETALRRLVA